MQIENDVVIAKTLPIDTENGLFLDLEDAQNYGASLHDAYIAEQPFPHIVIDEFLPNELIQKVLAQFPAMPTEREKNFENPNTGFHKRQISPYSCGPELASIFMFFNSAPVLQFLEKLTGIKSLIPDPYFDGGGLHETGAGGKLAVHTDFRIYKAMHLQRRINIIIYLNEDWQDSYGGHLELWDADMKACQKSVAPIINRCVVFNTDDKSNHGHPNPLTPPEGRVRRSIALYYYTASQKIYDDIDHDRTLYKARPNDSLKVKVQTKYRESRDKRKVRSDRGKGLFSRFRRE